MYLLGCLGYLLYYLLREYKWFRNQSHQQEQIEFNISKSLKQQLIINKISKDNEINVEAKDVKDFIKNMGKTMLK
mgnify:CR=1 FL=1